VDTGMPTIHLGLARNGRYAQEGAPENASPYDGTAVKLPGRLKPAAKPKVKAASKKVAKPQARPKPRPAARPKPKPKPVAQPKPAARPAAFEVAGVPAEPLDEPTLPDRARRLQRWVKAHPRRTPANVRHWLYQHAWIVTGARFGWYRGAEAIEILIGVDELVQRRWGIGAKSEAAARRALAAVRGKAR
jgi:hypothetical protein